MLIVCGLALKKIFLKSITERGLDLRKMGVNHMIVCGIALNKSPESILSCDSVRRIIEFFRDPRFPILDAGLSKTCFWTKNIDKKRRTPLAVIEMRARRTGRAMA